MTIRSRGLALGLFAVLAVPLSAHPHVWAEVRAEVTVAAGYVEGVWAVWTFDEVFSQIILSDHDADGNGLISAQESIAIQKGYFDNLKTYEYFSHLGLGSKKVPVPTPEKFVAAMGTDGRISYRFFLPLGLRLDAKTALAVSFYDDTFYADMYFQQKAPVTLKVTDGGRAAVALRPDKTRTYYSGQVTPTFAFITWSPS